MDQYGQQGNYGQQQQAPPPYPPQGDYDQQQAPPPYPPPGGYPPPGYPPQQQPRRKSWPRRHKVLTALLATVGLIIIISVASAAGGGGNSGSTSTSTGTTSGAVQQQAAPPAAAGPHVGQAAADGKFSFTVTGLGHSHQVGDQYLSATAQGRYTVLTITAKNIGTESQTLDDSAQYVYDAAGRKFSADSDADIYGNPGGNGGVFLSNINPGNTITGRLYFDLPRGDKAVKAELHDSVFSGGVTVSLTH